MAAEGSQEETHHELDGEAQEREKQISTLLSDLNLRDLLIQKLTEDGPWPNRTRLLSRSVVIFLAGTRLVEEDGQHS